MATGYRLQRADPDTVDETSINVLWEDQQKINLFGRLNSRLKELEMELKVLREETANLDDASDEIYISDEIKYALGEVFIDADQDQVEEMISEQMDKSKALMKKTEKEQEEILERMKVLKGELYAKFGKAINLEDNRS